MGLEGELEAAQGDIAEGGHEADGFAIDHGGNAFILEDEISGVPVAMADDGIIPGVTGVIGGIGGEVVGAEEGIGKVPDVLVGIGGVFAFGGPGGDGLDVVSDAGAVVVGSRGYLVGGGELFEGPVEEAEGFSGVFGGRFRAGVGFSIDVFEQLVDGGVGLEHGAVAVSGSDESGDGEMLAEEVELEVVGQRDAVGIVVTEGAFFKEEFSFFGPEDQWISRMVPNS